MKCSENKNKYDISNIPASKQTKDGSNLNIDSIALIGRMLTTQDDCFAEEMEAMQVRITTNLAEVMTDFTRNIFKKLDAIQKDVSEIKSDISVIKEEILDIYNKISLLQKRILKAEKQIISLENKINKK